MRSIKKGSLRLVEESNKSSSHTQQISVNSSDIGVGAITPNFLKIEPVANVFVFRPVLEIFLYQAIRRRCSDFGPRQRDRISRWGSSAVHSAACVSLVRDLQGQYGAYQTFRTKVWTILQCLSFHSFDFTFAFFCMAERRRLALCWNG